MVISALRCQALPRDVFRYKTVALPARHDPALSQLICFSFSEQSIDSASYVFEYLSYSSNTFLTPLKYILYSMEHAEGTGQDYLDNV